MTDLTRRQALATLGSATLGSAALGLTGPAAALAARPRAGAAVGPVGVTLQSSRIAGTFDSSVRALHELGVEMVRVPLNRTATGKGRTIVRRLTEEGFSVLGLTAGYEGLLAPDGGILTVGEWLAYVEDLLEIYPEVRTWQILNEPQLFEGISERTYVQTYLAPSFERIKERDPGITVVSAAPVGNTDGPDRFRALVDAGVADWCDVVAIHVYTSSPDAYAGLVARPIWVTETGSPDPGARRGFFERTVRPMFGPPLGAERVFWFEMLDERLTGFGLIGPDGAPTETGTYEAIAAFNRDPGTP